MLNRVFSSSSFCIYSDIGLGLNMLFGNFPKSSLNHLNNIVKTVKKINYFSELCSSAKRIQRTMTIARKTQTEIRITGTVWNFLELEVFALDDGLILKYKKWNIPCKIALT